MRYWKCSCGKYESFGSDGPRPCQVCDKCGTTMLKRADGTYVESEPHDLVTETKTVLFRDETKVTVWTYCANCLLTIERKNELPKV